MVNGAISVLCRVSVPNRRDCTQALQRSYGQFGYDYVAYEGVSKIISYRIYPVGIMIISPPITDFNRIAS